MTAERLSAHPQKPILCHSAALISEKTDADLITHPLHSNPILWHNLFPHSALIVQQSLSNLAILTQEHDTS